MKPPSQVNKKHVFQVPAATMTMPSQHGNRPVRTAKQVQLAPGYVDSSTLLFDSEDEGIESGGETYREHEGNDEGDDEVPHVNKKLRLKGKFKAQAKIPPPRPDSSCLVYYPETYAAVQRWNKSLGLPPPHPMSDASTTNVPERGGDIDAPGGSILISIKLIKRETSSDPYPLRFRHVNKNKFFDETKAGFESLPGEIRNQIYALVFKKRAPIDFTNRSGFARSAAFLRVNRLIYNEARVFVYGENRFCFGYNFSKSGQYFEPEWKELAWSHIRRFLTDIGPENTSLIKTLGILFSDASQSTIPYVPLDLRRFTHSKDVLWILDYLGKHGKILNLKLAFCGRRIIRLSIRDSDFLNALKGVKTDDLEIGDPRSEGRGDYSNRYYGKIDAMGAQMLKAVMVRPLPLKDLDPRLKF